jgi:hypothetical protein
MMGGGGGGSDMFRRRRPRLKICPSYAKDPGRVRSMGGREGEREIRFRTLDGYIGGFDERCVLQGLDLSLPFGNKLDVIQCSLLAYERDGVMLVRE